MGWVSPPTHTHSPIFLFLFFSFPLTSSFKATNRSHTLAHLATGFLKKRTRRTGSRGALTNICPGKAWRHIKIAGREQINGYLQVGRLVCPLQSPPGNIKLQALHLSGNAIAVKRTKTCCPIPSAVSRPLLAPENRHAHGLLGHPLGRGHAAWCSPRGFLASRLRQPHRRCVARVHGFLAGHSRQPHRQPHTWFGMRTVFFSGHPWGDRGSCLLRTRSPAFGGWKFQQRTGAGCHWQGVTPHWLLLGGSSSPSLQAYLWPRLCPASQGGLEGLPGIDLRW